MSLAPITEREIEDYRACVGRTLTQEDIVDRRVAEMFAATLSVEVPTVDLPPLWHYGLFLPFVQTALLDTDGHPRRGDFLPPVRLPRRMFAGSSLNFHRLLMIGMPATRISRIASVDHRSGKGGDLIFVRVASSISQQDAPVLDEEQTIVYRPGGVTGAVVPVAHPNPEPRQAVEIWLPSTTELFRFSAATFNGHRIHYDLPYATEIEGYPALVVHGPLIAMRLCAFAGKIAGRELATFTFRGEAPAFVGQELRLVGACDGSNISVRAERADGVTAMSANAASIRPAA